MISSQLKTLMDPLYIAMIVVGAMSVFLVVFAIAFGVWLCVRKDRDKRGGGAGVAPTNKSKTTNHSNQRAAHIVEATCEQSSRVAPSPMENAADTSNTTHNSPSRRANS